MNIDSGWADISKYWGRFMDAERRYALLKELASSVPDFANKTSTEVLTWLGRLHALIDHRDFGTDPIAVQVASQNLGGITHSRNVSTIMTSLYRAIAQVELKLPASSQGAFIPAGNAFDALAATARILEEAKSDLLIVDPYLGPKMLEHFALQAREGVRIRLLGGKSRVRAGLQPAVEAWIAQFGADRPINLHLADPKLLHDRLIIADLATVWDVSQSFEDLAARSPATLSKANADQAPLKVDAYLDIFDSAEVIV